MKKLLFLLSFGLLIVSCGPGKVATEARKTINGNWVLNEITYPGQTGTFNVTLFNDATANCFRGSAWVFVSNNNTGIYTLEGAACPVEQRFFRWSVDEKTTAEGSYDLLLKPTNSDYKSFTGGQGFRLNLVYLTDTTMTWEQTLTLEGKPFTIRMNFNKL